jgi:transposase
MFKPHTKKQEENYDKAITLYYEQGFSSNKTAKVLGLGRSTIDRWIAIFAKENPRVASIMKRQPKQKCKPEVIVNDGAKDGQALPGDVQSLQEELRRLRKQLTEAEIKAEAYDELINVAEAKFGIQIRKKVGAKQ